MDSAKAAIKDFLGKSGQHDTTVHEKVNPAVTNETITRTEHERPTTVVDKEVHQDHHHTSVQPINEAARLPEQHHHKVIPVEHRQFEHGNTDEDRQRVAAEHSKFQDSVRRVEGEHATSVQQAVGGEHHHHHIHETIQPVINRATVEPHVVHTTVPVHEQHHNAAQHHATSVLPAVSREEFERQGGVLSGREERTDGFAGEPRAIGQQTLGHKGDSHVTGDNVTRGDHASATGAGFTGSATGAAVGAGHHSTGHHAHGTDSHNQTKPSLLDKLNPKVDADGDGKAGFLK